MVKNVLYKRDLLFPTDNVSEPGGIYVEILNPNKKGRMPVIIECKSAHSPIRYINQILRIMQSDIFDRILVDIKSNVRLYIKPSDELKKEYGGKKYIEVAFVDDQPQYTGVDSIEGK